MNFNISLNKQFTNYFLSFVKINPKTTTFVIALGVIAAIGKQYWDYQKTKTASAISSAPTPPTPYNLPLGQQSGLQDQTPTRESSSPPDQQTSLPSQKKQIPLFQNFERSYVTRNQNKPCPPMNIFEEDTPLLDDLLTRWTLDSGICFFDLLGLDIYDNWKKQGADPKDLQKFCTLCKKLSVELLKCTQNPEQTTAFPVIRNLFQLLENNIPAELQPKFTLLLKVLHNPQHAVVLGYSAVELFDRNEILDGNYSEPEDVLSFLDFVHQMHPKELASICNTPVETEQKYADLSQKIMKLKREIETSLDSKDPKYTDKTDLYNQLSTLKQIIDQRMLNKKLPISRLILNLKNTASFNKSTHKDWIEKIISKHVSKTLINDFKQIILKHYLSNLSSTANMGELCLADDDAYKMVDSLACRCEPKDLPFLETKILKKLDFERQNCKDPEEYAIIFSDMVCLYQIIHDIGIFKGVTLDQLEKRHIPDSFAERAFLPSATTFDVTPPSLDPFFEEPTPGILIQNTLSLSSSSASASATAFDVTPPSLDPFFEEPTPGVLIQNTLSLSSSPASASATALHTALPNSLSQLASIHARKVKIKSRPEKPEAVIEQHASPIVSFLSPPVERPYFPPRGSSGQEVLRHLLNHGFVIQRTGGGHYQMEHVTTKVHTTIPYHSSIKQGTLSSIRNAFYRSQGFLN